MSGISEESLFKLLRACKKLGVQEFEYAGVKIIMKSDETPEEKKVSSKEKPRLQKDITDQAELQERFDFAKELTETMHVEDPLGFEQKLIEGEFGVEKAYDQGTESALY